MEKTKIKIKQAIENDEQLTKTLLQCFLYLTTVKKQDSIEMTLDGNDGSELIIAFGLTVKPSKNIEQVKK